MIGGGGGGFGVSFLPSGDRRYQRPEDQQGPLGRAPIQEAIKILSMRVPRVVGANPLAPLALLGGPGASGLQPGQLQQLMRTLGVGPQMQASQAPGAGGGPGVAIGGAESPFAPQSALMPAGGASPMASVTAGMTDPGGSAGGAMPPPAGPPAPMAPPMDTGGGGEDDSAALYELARRQREAMGRIAY